MKIQESSFSVILLYVDDMVIIGNNEKAIKDMKNFVSTCFKIKKTWTLKYSLGVKVA